MGFLVVDKWLPCRSVGEPVIGVMWALFLPCFVIWLLASWVHKYQVYRAGLQANAFRQQLKLDEIRREARGDPGSR
jgi:hypothetical protein